VLSWSLLESMSIQCAIVACRTAPVEEVITDREHGLLVDFFDQRALVESVCELLDDAALRERLGSSARARVEQDFDLKRRCLPAQLGWVSSVMSASHNA